MVLTAQQGKLDELYKKNFGDTRNASFGTKGGADYWLTEHNPQTQEDWDKIDAMLGGSDEGVKYAASVAAGTPTVLPGGIDPTKSISSQSGPGTWASHFLDGGTFANENAAGAITAIADDIGFTPSEAYFNNSVGGVNNDDDNTNIDNTNNTNNTNTTSNWYDGYASGADWLAANPQDSSSSSSSTGGMDDFMKFMMLMSVMGGKGGGGYGGSQYGYGGLNPGGVMQSYDPLAQLQGMGTWFKDNFGSGGATTSTVNTGTTT